MRERNEEWEYVRNRLLILVATVFALLNFQAVRQTVEAGAKAIEKDYPFIADLIRFLFWSALILGVLISVAFVWLMYKVFQEL